MIIGLIVAALVGMMLVALGRIPQDAMLAFPLPDNRAALRVLGGLLMGFALLLLVVALLTRPPYVGADATTPTTSATPSALPTIRTVGTVTPTPTISPTPQPTAPVQSARAKLGASA